MKSPVLMLCRDAWLHQTLLAALPGSTIPLGPPVARHSNVWCCAVFWSALNLFFFFSIAPQVRVSIQQEKLEGSSAGLLHATAQVPAKQLAPSTSATGLTSQQLHCFTPMEDLGQGDYGNVQVCWCRACQPDLLLLPQPAEQQHRSTGAGETCTVRSFFIILLCQSGTSKRQYFLFPFKENTMTVLQTGRLF